MLKIMIFSYDNDLYWQINKSYIKKIKLKSEKRLTKLQFNLNKTKIYIGVNNKSIEKDLLAIGIIKNLIELIAAINDIDLGEINYISVPIEGKGIVHIDCEINFKNIISLIKGVRWTKKKIA